MEIIKGLFIKIAIAAVVGILTLAAVFLKDKYMADGEDNIIQEIIIEKNDDFEDKTVVDTKVIEEEKPTEKKEAIEQSAEIEEVTKVEEKKPAIKKVVKIEDASFEDYKNNIHTSTPEVIKEPTVMEEEVIEQPIVIEEVTKIEEKKPAIKKVVKIEDASFEDYKNNMNTSSPEDNAFDELDRELNQ